MRFPKQRDVIVLDAEPHSGKEYGGHGSQEGNIRRHMVVMSSSEYARATGLVLVMPITTSAIGAGNPRYLPVLITGGQRDGVKGYIALWQLQNFDFNSRHGVIVNQVSSRTYNELLPYVKDMLGI